MKSLSEEKNGGRKPEEEKGKIVGEDVIRVKKVIDISELQEELFVWRKQQYIGKQQTDEDLTILIWIVMISMVIIK